MEFDTEDQVLSLRDVTDYTKNVLDFIKFCKLLGTNDVSTL